MSCEMPESPAFASDPWRRRMRTTADRLRLLDAHRFEAQIEKIESCLVRDAHWDLQAALESCCPFSTKIGSVEPR